MVQEKAPIVTSSVIANIICFCMAVILKNRLFSCLYCFNKFWKYLHCISNDSILGSFKNRGILICVYRNNIFSYRNSRGRYTYYNSLTDSINVAASGLSNNYLITTGQWYYNGFTIHDINYHYCVMDDGRTPKYSWGTQVASLMFDIYQKLQD